jgi:type I restriction enzyme S subunit
LRPVISKAGSLIYSFKLSVGQVAFINKDMYTNEALATFPSDNSNSVNYLYYAAPIFIVKNANVNIYGAFLLNQDLIKNANVLMPTISEQIQIAEFLDRETAKLDGLISRKQRLIELLKEKRQALITHVVTKGLDPHAKMKDSGVEWIGEIPEGWEVKKLRYLGDAIIGLTYSPNDLTDESENSIFVLRASNIQEGKFAEGDKVFVSKKVPNKLITKKNDLLITSRSGSRDLIGKSILIDDETENYSFGAFMLVFRGKYNSFLSFVSQSQIN